MPRFAVLALLLLVCGCGGGAPKSVYAGSCTSPNGAGARQVWNAEVRAELKLASQVLAGTFDAYEAELITTTLDAFTDRWSASQQDACDAHLERDELDRDGFDQRMACLAAALDSAQLAIDAVASGDRSILDRLDVLESQISRCV